MLGETPALVDEQRRQVAGGDHRDVVGLDAELGDHPGDQALDLRGDAEEHAALERLDRVVSIARRLGGARSVAEALPVVRELEEGVRALWLGLDADRDGRVVWGPPEGGLRQVQQHMTLLQRGEGLINQEGFPR